MKNERFIEKKLISEVKKQGGRAFKWVSPGCSGVPDRIVILPGPRILFVELKRPGCKDGRSARQKKIMGWLLQMGCEAHLVSEAEDIQRIMELDNGI